MRDGEIIGLDPDACRKEAIRFEEVARESEAIAQEYLEVCRIGQMEEFGEAIARDLFDVRDELDAMVHLLRTKSDEVEALDFSYHGWASQPLAISRVEDSFRFLSSGSNPKSPTSGRATPKTTPKTTPTTSKPSSPKRPVQPARTVGRTPTGSLLVGVALPSTGSFASFAWLGLSDADVQAANALAKRVLALPSNTPLSEKDAMGLGVYLWTRQHTYDVRGFPETNDVEKLLRHLSPADRSRVLASAQLLDANAYAKAEALKSPMTSEFMELMTSKEVRGWTPAELAAYVNKCFGETDPTTLAATATWISYQLRGAYAALNANQMRPESFGVHGWLAANVQPEQWAFDVVAGTPLRLGAPVTTIWAGNMFAGMLAGKVPHWSTSAYIPNWEAPPLTTAEKVLLVGTAVASIAALLVEGSAVAAGAGVAKGLVWLGVTAETAAFLGTAATFAVIGAVAGASQGLAERSVEALDGKRSWGSVVDPGTIGRDALIGGVISVVTFGVGSALKAGAGRIAVFEGRIGSLLKRIAAAKSPQERKVLEVLKQKEEAKLASEIAAKEALERQAAALDAAAKKQQALHQPTSGGSGPSPTPITVPVRGDGDGLRPIDGPDAPNDLPDPGDPIEPPKPRPNPFRTEEHWIAMVARVRKNLEREAPQSTAFLDRLIDSEWTDEVMKALPIIDEALENRTITGTAGVVRKMAGVREEKQIAESLAEIEAAVRLAKDPQTFPGEGSVQMSVTGRGLPSGSNIPREVIDGVESSVPIDVDILVKRRDGSWQMNESKKTANALRDALEQKTQFERFLELRDDSTVELEYVIQIQDENKGMNGLFSKLKSLYGTKEKNKLFAEVGDVTLTAKSPYTTLDFLVFKNVPIRVGGTFVSVAKLRELQSAMEAFGRERFAKEVLPNIRSLDDVIKALGVKL